jgi:hypothetical protein
MRYEKSASKITNIILSGGPDVMAKSYVKTVDPPMLGHGHACFMG